MAQVIYKICRADEWREAERAGAFRGAPIDLRDGYIHFSTGEQVAETAARHFAGIGDLVLVAVDAAALGAGAEMGAVARRRAVSASLRRADARRRALGQAAAARRRRPPHLSGAWP